MFLFFCHDINICKLNKIPAKKYIFVFIFTGSIRVPMIIINKKIEKFINYAGKNLNAPQQSIIMGATALVFQPYINRKNNRLDQDTKDMAVARSIGKNIAGNFFDFVTRVGAFFAVVKLSNYKTNDVKNDEDIVKELIPKNQKKDIFTPNLGNKFAPRSKREFLKDYKSYRLAMGALLATGVAVFIKTTVELPLTKKLTDIFYKLEKSRTRRKNDTSNNTEQSNK